MTHSTGLPIELDVYVESLKLAVEYQGEQHYKAIHWSSDFVTQQIRDEEKRRACKQVLKTVVIKCVQHNVTLVEVPYWWDRTTESLAATIHKVRSDTIAGPPVVDCIPTSPPTSLNKEEIGIPVCHGFSWNENQDVTGWFVRIGSSLM